MTPRSLAAKTALVAAALTLTATGAAAATGSLPAEAQDALAGAAERVGFELPRAKEADEADTTDDVTTETDAETGAVTDAGTGGPEDPAGTADDHGRMVASIANRDFESGRQHGEDVSTAARQQGEAHRSDQAAEADQNGAAGEHGEAPVTTPNEGDAATEAGNPAAEQAPVTPNHGTAADDTPAADRPAPVDAGTAAEDRTARS